MNRRRRQSYTPYLVIVFGGIIAMFIILAIVYFTQKNNTNFPEETTSVSETVISEETEPAEETAAEETTKDEFEIESIEESGEWMYVTTDYGTFKYPFAFSDLIHIEAVDLGESAQLVFSMNGEDSLVHLYTINYNSDEGFLCGTLKQSDAAEIPVTVVFGELSEGISEDWRVTFYAVQETFNDVLFSMAEDENFTLAE